MKCPTCGHDNYPGQVPPEPPIGTWVKDRFGATIMRHPDGGWAPPGCMPLAVWDKMWNARGPLVICGPYGEELDDNPS